MRCELREFYCLTFTRIEHTTNALHEFDLRIEDARSSRLATQARTKARLFRGLGQIEKFNALAVCAT